MSRKSALSKEEIVKQFDLPERRSKIATLMKQDEVAYCICRSSDTDSFMIGCDSCEEWYHGDCIGISEKASKDIKRYYCERCRLEDPSLMTRYKVSRPEPEKKKHKPKTSRCERCSNCSRREDCGRCPGCKSGDWCLHRICLQARTKARDNSPEWEPPSYWKRTPSPELRHKKSDERKKKKRGRKRAEEVKENRTSHRGRKRKESAEEEHEAEEKFPYQQCYGPTCTKATRRNSKYCSDECGLKMAQNRIYQILPQRIQEWSLTPCVAGENNKKALEEIRSKVNEVRTLLKDLDDRNTQLDKLIERGKQCKVEEQDEKDEEDGPAETTTMYCITCGLEIHLKTAIRHMDKCFNKNEARTSFGSIYKTRIQGNNMFCDFFNPTNATYCKRLRVMCPEHAKEPKACPTDVCGCPLVTNVFTQTGAFCRTSKLNCKKHYSWEKIWRAEIDMERVRQWLKLDELVEKEREIRNHLANRGGVLALMLHSTYNHELMEQVTTAYNEGQ